MANDVTIRDIARLSGVSYSTVSRALNGVGRIKPSTRKKVMEAASQLGYVPNRQARSLAGGQSNVIGMLVHGLDTDYIGQILKGADEELAQASYELMVFTTHRHKNKELSTVTRLMSGLTDGLLIVLPEGHQHYVKNLQEKNLPYVLVDTAVHSDDEGVTVTATNNQGAYEATKHLLNLGHERIGFITGNLNLQIAVSRFEGYQRALTEAGIPFDIALIREGNFLQPRGREAALELLQRKHPPSAIFASNDVMALGVLEAAYELGVRVPDDLSVVGFDDVASAEYAIPKLTTVRQPIYEMGVVAARSLLGLLRGEEVSSVQLGTQLIVRASTAPVSVVENTKREAKVSRDDLN